MPNIRDLIDFVRYQVNQIFNIDIVKVSGQHTLNAHLCKVIEFYKIDVIIDVGANEGHFGLLVRRLGFKGDIHSFEPVIGAFEVLSSLASNDARWHVHNFALGSQAGEAEINVSKFSQYSSLLNANDYGNSWGDMKVQHRQKIKISTLSECFNKLLIPSERKILLKMDTQGFDLEVFKGVGKYLDHVCCMLSELSLVPIYNGMPHYLDALAAYEKQGFCVTGFYPITRKPNLVLNEVDCMLVNSTVSESQKCAV